jgi:hypothetical protein
MQKPTTVAGPSRNAAACVQKVLYFARSLLGELRAVANG